MSTPKSTIGLRALWKCAACRKEAITHQIENLGPLHTVVLAPPPGWQVREGQTICDDHGLAAECRCGLCEWRAA